MNVAVFWNVVPFGLVDIDDHAYSLHHQGGIF
jgi:hypothetical protein